MVAPTITLYWRLVVGIDPRPAAECIGEGAISGATRDRSDLSGLLEDGVTPRDLAGGFGSAIAYSGRKNLYVATPDRGPADGTTSYVDRGLHDQHRREAYRCSHRSSVFNRAGSRAGPVFDAASRFVATTH